MALPHRPLLSVIVPFHDVEPYFAFLLGSLRDQAMRDAEFILVADEPQDGSLAIAQSFAREDPRFVILETPRGGPGPAKNLGVSRSSGTFVTFADGDDAVTTHGYATMVRTLLRTGSHFATANALRFDDDMRVWQSWTHRHAFNRNRLRTHLAESPDLAGDRMTTSKVFRRDFWHAADLSFPARLYEDIPVAMKAYASAAAVDVIKDYCYLWRARQANNSITQSVHDASNAYDRATSALEVLDTAAQKVPGVLSEVATHVMEIDVPAIAAVLDENRTPRLDEIAGRLDERLAEALGQEHVVAATQAQIAAPPEPEPSAAPPPPHATLTHDAVEHQVRVCVDSDTGWTVRALSFADARTGAVVRTVAGLTDSTRGACVVFETAALTEGLSAERVTVHALVTHPDVTVEHSVPVHAGVLPTAAAIEAGLLTWGRYAAGTLELVPVKAEQTARFHLSEGCLTVSFGDDTTVGTVELRDPTGVPAARARLVRGRATFDVRPLAQTASPLDPIRRRTQWLILLDQAGDCRQLHPVSLDGDDAVGPLSVSLSRNPQGAVELAFAWPG